MNVLYLDCFSGISGDMSVATLLDLGIDEKVFLNEIKKLSVADEFDVIITKANKNGISATDFNVVDKHLEHHHHGRNYADISNIINSGQLSEKVKEISLKIFDFIAEAEAKIHGTKKDEVHFHEVGAIDSIVDIVGFAICVDILKVDKVVTSALSEGHGFVRCRHGLIPVPVPATAQILAMVDAKIKYVDIESELVTPTGAAIIAATTSEFGVMPQMTNVKIGYGAGKKNFDTPNVLRAFFGQTDDLKSYDKLVLLETNIDDMSGEINGFVMEKLFEQGALDVYYTPIYMKKNRPAVMLSVLCKIEDREKFEYLILENTTTIGIRACLVERLAMKREIKSVNTSYGVVRVKECRYKDIIKSVLEYEDIKAIAKEKSKPFIEIYNEILRQI